MIKETESKKPRMTLEETYSHSESDRSNRDLVSLFKNHVHPITGSADIGIRPQLEQYSNSQRHKLNEGDYSPLAKNSQSESSMSQEID